MLPSLLRRLFILLGKEIFDIKFKNLILETNIRDPHDREIFFTQKYEEDQLLELFSIIKNNNINIFIDVGANSGIYSLLLSNAFDCLIVNAFEPIKSTYNKFLRNIEKNNLSSKIKTYNLGLSNNTGILKMDTNVKFGYHQSAGYFVSDTGDKKAIFNKADNILNYKNKNILIKIDTEGHEKFVLDGMLNLIQNNNIFLQVEIWNKNSKKIEEFLNNNNFIFQKKIQKDYYFIKNN